MKVPKYVWVDVIDDEDVLFCQRTASEEKCFRKYVLVTTAKPSKRVGRKLKGKK